MHRDHLEVLDIMDALTEAHVTRQMDAKLLFGVTVFLVEFKVR